MKRSLLAAIAVVCLLVAIMPGRSQVRKIAPPRPAMRRLTVAPGIDPVSGVTVPPNTHLNVLTWTASTDSTASNPGSVIVLKQVGACPVSGGLTSPTTLTTSAPAAGPWEDTAVLSGQVNCYSVEALIGGETSAQSNTLQLTTPGFPPTNLAGTAY